MQKKTTACYHEIMQKTLIAFILTLSSFAHATDAWIHVVGIDETDPQQNHSNFYKSAQEFENACTERNKDCIQFLNTDPKLTSNPGEIPSALKMNIASGIVTKSAFMTAIEEKLKKANDTGESVVISLKDHGAPFPGRGSCVALSSSEFFCADDMKKILQKYPNAKVLISADACYSGSFTDLSSANTCVLTFADRLHYGLGGTGRSIWNSIIEQRLKNAADIAEPIFREIGTGPLLGSQQILQQLCAPARQKIGPDSLSKLSYKLRTPILEDPRDCRDPDNTPQKAVGLAKDVLEIISKSDTLSCENLKLPSQVCSARERLKKASPEIQNALPRLQEIFAIQETLPEQYINMITKLNDPHSTVSQAKNNFSLDELKELTDSVALKQEPDWKKFSSSKLVLAKQFWNEYHPLAEMLTKKKNLENESDAIIAKLKEKGYYDDMMTVQNCLFESSEYLSNKDFTTEYWEQNAKSNPVRQFTEKDYEVARKCESSFRF